MENDQKKDRVPPVIHKDNPDADLEEKLKLSPNDPGTKVDVGSDESMDASDPSSAVQPAHDEPVPSSGSPDDRD